MLYVSHPFGTLCGFCLCGNSSEGINDVTADLRYTLDADGTLRFFGGADESVIVYNLQGLTVASAAGDASITLPSRGIYLLMRSGTDGSKVTRKIAW